MILEPYKRHPVPPRVAVLTEEGAIVDEDGQRLDESEVEPGTRVFGQWDVVHQLTASHVGEALCWNNEEVRWRLEPHPDEAEWKRRPSDVFVLRLPLTETLTPAGLLRALVGWRDWLASYRAAPTGTTGSSAMSLLRARLERIVVTGQGERPPLIQTRGGRMQLGPTGRGRFEGRLVLLDLPAAYASLIGEAEYGGVWRRLEPGAKLDWWLDQEAPLFLSTTVTPPASLGVFGPLYRSFRHRVSFAEQEVYRSSFYADGSSFLYPTGRRISGVWTREEVRVAIEAGCRVRIRGGWVQRAEGTPFAEWWTAVQAGRDELAGVGSLLAKMTGNALWGRFCLDPKVAGRRTIRHAGVARELRSNPAAWPAHDLAEYVSGTVRARLYALTRWAGSRLVSANTDGAWIRDDGSPPPEGWRVKARAHRLDVLEPACLRYWPERSRWPRHVVAGVPFARQAEVFEQRWAEWESAA